MDIENFVDKNLQQFLSESGWELRFNEFKSVLVSKLYPEGKSGMQIWRNGEYELAVHFEDDGRHTVNLYYGDIDCESFRIRNIRSVLKRRGLTGGERNGNLK